MINMIQQLDRMLLQMIKKTQKFRKSDLLNILYRIYFKILNLFHTIQSSRAMQELKQFQLMIPLCITQGKSVMVDFKTEKENQFHQSLTEKVLQESILLKLSLFCAYF